MVSVGVAPQSRARRPKRDKKPNHCGYERLAMWWPRCDVDVNFDLVQIDVEPQRRDLVSCALDVFSAPGLTDRTLT